LAARGARELEALAVGTLAFVERVKSELGIKAMHRGVEQAGWTYALWESREAYGREFAQENEALRPENTILWKKFTETAET
jgi:hypothetical protein